MSVKGQFEALLKKSEINYKVSTIEQGTLFQFVNETDPNTQIMLGAIFNEENSDVDFQLHSPLGIVESKNRAEVLELVNKLNYGYRYGKFLLLDDAQVIMKDSFAILDDEIDHSQMILDTMLILFKVAEECFPVIHEFQNQ